MTEKEVHLKLSNIPIDNDNLDYIKATGEICGKLRDDLVKVFADTDIPKVNETYDFYDDGKIRESRRDVAKITDVIKFDDIDGETLELWESEVSKCHWLYKPTTDYFVKASLEIAEQEVNFVRTIDNEWFSLGWWAGLLDLKNEFKE